MRADGFDASPLFQFYNSPKANVARSIRLTDAIVAAKRFGLCAESHWPYRPDLVDVKPPAEVYREAKRSRIGIALPCPSLEDKLRCLGRRMPLLLSYDVALLAQLGLPVLDVPSHRHGHVSVLWGFDARREVIFLRNSWGDVWGNRGNCEVPWRLLSDRNLMGDCFAVTLAA
jgi:hypothetical protein